MKIDNETYYDQDGNITSPPASELDYLILILLGVSSPFWIGLSLYAGLKVSTLSSLQNSSQIVQEMPFKK